MHGSEAMLLFHVAMLIVANKILIPITVCHTTHSDGNKYLLAIIFSYLDFP